MMDKTIGDYYRMYNNGDIFSDEDLDKAIEKMGQFANELNSLGFAFILPYRELRRVYDGLQRDKFDRGCSVFFTKGSKNDNPN